MSVVRNPCRDVVLDVADDVTRTEAMAGSSMDTRVDSAADTRVDSAGDTRVTAD